MSEMEIQSFCATVTLCRFVSLPAHSGTTLRVNRCPLQVKALTHFSLGVIFENVNQKLTLLRIFVDNLLLSHNQ